MQSMPDNFESFKKNQEDAFNQLIADYSKNLPTKINELIALWKNLKETWRASIFTRFKFKLHHLSGSAGTFGYDDLGNQASALEQLLHKKDQLSSEEKQFVDRLLEILIQYSLQLPRKICLPVVHSQEPLIQKLIFVLDNDQEWVNHFSEKIMIFGYVTRQFDHLSDLIKALSIETPTVLLININLIENKSEKELDELKTNYFENIPLLISASNGEFQLRLKAVWLGASAYFIKPILIDELIIELDHLLALDKAVYRVLIIDDDTEVADYYLTVLSKLGISATVINKASHTDYALHEFSPDLILLDLHMPNCNGYQLAAIIRQQKCYEYIPILFLSVEKNKIIQQRVMSVGVDDFIPKSIEPALLASIIKNKISRYKSLRTLTIKDNLTGAFNHTFIFQQLQLEIDAAMKIHIPLSIAILDLDLFTDINHTYHHTTGDYILRSFYLMLENRLHTSCIIGRYGNDQFVVILPDADIERTTSLIDMLREEFVKIPFYTNNRTFHVSFSAGVASSPPHQTNVAIIKSANEALIRAKKAGRNRVEVMLEKAPFVSHIS